MFIYFLSVYHENKLFDVSFPYLSSNFNLKRHNSISQQTYSSSNQFTNRHLVMGFDLPIVFGNSYSISYKIFIPTDIWLKGAVQICCLGVIIQLSIGHPHWSIDAVRSDQDIKFQVYIGFDSSTSHHKWKRQICGVWLESFR